MNTIPMPVVKTADYTYYAKDARVQPLEKLINQSSNDGLAKLSFGDSIRILLIPSSDWRVLCYFLGVNAVTDVKNHPTSNPVLMIGHLFQECVVRYMKTIGYTFAGEVAFDQNGNAIPVQKHTWELGGSEVTFTSNGWLYFESPNSKDENVSFLSWTNANECSAGMTCYARTAQKARSIIEGLESFTKKHNSLRGKKLADVNMHTGGFKEVVPDSKYTWDNFYFPKQIRDMFELEVFGFLKNTERYNSLGIRKRGIMLHGRPGTGKTTAGHIICNYARESTVIWITPELLQENNGGKQGIKLLYMLADYISPSVIILEDLDLFSEDREGVVDQLRLGALMNILDGVNSVTNSVTVATTNRLNLVEKALSNRPGRFDRVVEVPPLEGVLRRKMFSDRLDGCEVMEGAMDLLLKESEGWTGAESQEFINSLNLYFINRDEDRRRIVTKDVVQAVCETMTCLSTTKSSKRIGF